MKKLQENKKKIALIGHMGSGKSLIGKLIAKKLAFEHIDTDKLIELQLNTTIKNIFVNQGESKFREIEEELILSLGKKNSKQSL